jgi:putative ATP-dependent endonuclease of OLD family
MHLSNLKLWNFRKYGTNSILDPANPNLDLNFHAGLNVLVGENDSGKSAIIDAIKIVLKTHSYEFIKANDEDFYKTSNEFRIEIVFKGFTDEEAANFTEWLSWEGAGAAAIPYLKLSYYVTRKDGRILPSDIRAGADDDGYLLTAQARAYLKATYLKPLRDAKSELIPKKNSRLSQIFQEHEAFKGKQATHLLVDLFTRFNKEIENYFLGTDHGGAPIADLLGKELKDSIDGYLKSFYDSSKQTDITSSDGNLKSILEKLELLIKDEMNIGLGTLNRLFMASELLHLNKKNWNGIRLALIEELEAHLHPQAQMQVVETLQKQKNVQLILSTHSPNLASKVKLENIILCCGNNAFPLGKEYTMLEQKKDYPFLERFLDVTKANLFFAKGVIMVEGWSEELLLPALARAMKRQGLIQKDLTEAGVSIVNVGNTGLLNYAKIFLRKSGPSVNIPVAVVTDVDIRTYKKIIVVDADGNPQDDYEKLHPPDVEKASYQKLLILIQKNTEQNVLSFITGIWTLEYSCLHSTSLRDHFMPIVKAVHSGSDWDTDFEKELARKLIMKGLNKVEIAYRLAEVIDQSGSGGASPISFNHGDTLCYLTDAIIYVCNN